ncbi:hypothetical protein DB345_12590 [Spartobacteria bacterium LR76]|nr:hypothetical protein DB345_12590 [Spartobacteria bacterium LR76]
MLYPRSTLACLCALLLGLAAGHAADDARSLLVTQSPESESTVYFTNLEIGAMLFYNSGFYGQRSVIANVEAGYIWNGHDVFDRSQIPAELGVSSAVTQYVADASITPEYDFHATMVGHVLAGTGYTTENGGQFIYDGSDILPFVKAGIAPFAELWSGAIATSFSSEDIGSFSTTTESTLTPYRTFFRGINGRKADVINSSWGGYDPGANADTTRTIDALARENSTVVFVVSAGNSGDFPVSAPGSGYNNITVGSVGGTHFLTPSDFSSREAVDFYNPATGETITGVRAAVDIAAPGEDLFLAAYLGKTGSLASLTDVVQDISPTDLYFLRQSGTSFAAPIVAGGIGLLKDVVHYYEENGVPISAYTLDTRVVKSVLMAGATRTEGWNNGQTDQNGIVTTTQSLDYATGAGAMNLEKTADIYLLSGTRDVAGLGGDSISAKGWDYGQLAEGGANEYRFADAFTGQVELTISLNWFTGTDFDENDIGQSLSFANLNLEVWQIINGALTNKVAESISLYNNTEFLRIALDNPGEYAIRVAFLGMIYDLDPSANNTDYALAWQTETVPEPSTWLLMVFGLAAAIAFRQRAICIQVSRR